MAEILGIGQNTYTNWKKSLHDKRKGSSHPNNAKYSEEERQQALEALLLNPDMSPSELQAKYLDEHGVYLGSVKWLYRLLEKIKCNSKRGTDKNSNKEDSVDRRTLEQGEYYYLYAVMDLYSRKMLHWEVHDIQSAEIAAKFIEKAVEKVGFIKGDNTLIRADGRNTDIFGKVLDLHSDNGAPMRGSTMVAKCLELGISCTYNRPRHSNDNAHMEGSKLHIA